MIQSITFNLNPNAATVSMHPQFTMRADGVFTPIEIVGHRRITCVIGRTRQSGRTAVDKFHIGTRTTEWAFDDHHRFDLSKCEGIFVDSH